MLGRFSHDQYVELTMHFRCNLACTHCMIEGTMDWLEPESVGRLRQVLDHNQQQHTWKGLILTGAEITLRRDLPDLARLARANGFERVRIQTHGMRLADLDYCRELIDAGVNEFFVSVAGPDAEAHDGITTVPGSFDKTVRGLENLDRFEDVLAITNTVVTKLSYRHLPAVVDRLSGINRLAQMEFWNYWPMSETDAKDLLVSHMEVRPYLLEAVRRLRAMGRGVEVKNFPECLLREDRAALDNSQPKLLIDPAFWHEFRRNGFNQCVHRSACGYRHCLGLNSAYIRKFGWHADEFVPFAPVDRAAVEAEAASRVPLLVIGS